MTTPYLGDGHGSVPRKHRHGWDCFKTSGGMANAMDELAGSLTERIERVYKTAYATGYKNGRHDMAQEAIDNGGRSPREL